MKWCADRWSKWLLGCCLIALALVPLAPAFGQSEDEVQLWDSDASLALLPTDDYSPVVSANPLPGGGILLEWTADGVLQVSDSPDGPWSDLWNAGSPFVIEGGDTKGLPAFQRSDHGPS